MRRMLICCLAAVLPPLSAAPCKIAAQPPPLAITGVTVIDMADATPKSAMTVMVVGNRITTVGRTLSVRIPGNARVVDGTGKFLIPGLWDMHVHTLYDGRPEFFFPMFVANGVTGVREMGSTFSLDSIRTLREQIRRGEVMAPRFGAVAGKIFNGPDAPAGRLPEFMSFSDPAEARRMVQEYKRQGADFIKVYDLLSRDVYLAIVDEARKQNLTVAGHVPRSMSPREASAAGQRSIEHSTGMSLNGCVGDRAATNRNGAAQEQIDCQALFTLYRTNSTWQVPTLFSRYTLSVSYDSAFMLERYKYVPLNVREEWRRKILQRRQRSSDAQLKENWQYLLGLVAAMHRAGVPILAGTDVGFGNVNTFAGFGLHDELEVLVKAGLTPYEALQTATVHPARYLNLSGSLGTIEQGKLADLVLLDANPLDQIGNTRRIAGVVLNGRFISRQEREKMLADVEAAAARR
jgi:imidazolonepropionase-like amidohydrolase